MVLRTSDSRFESIDVDGTKSKVVGGAGRRV